MSYSRRRHDRRFASLSALTAFAMLVACDAPKQNEPVVLFEENFRPQRVAGAPTSKAQQQKQVQSFFDYVEATKTGSPLVESARVQAQSAQVALQTAQLSFGPTPYANSYVDPTTGAGTAAIGISQPIWTGGKLTANRDLAESDARVAANRPRLVGNQLSVQLVTAYGNWISAYLSQQVWQKNIAESQNILGLISSQEAEGFASGEELELAKKRLLAQQMLLQSSATELATQSLTIAKFLGHPADTAVLQRSISNYPVPDLSNPDNVIADAIANSPTLADLDLQMQKAQAEIRVAQADRMPDLTVRVERYQPDISSGLSGSENRVSLGFQTNFGPSFSKSRKVEQAILNRESAAYDREASAQEIQFNIQNAMTDYQNASAQEKVVSNLVTSSEALLNSYIRQFAQLERSWEEILSAQKDLADARAELAQVQATKIASAWKIALYTHP